MIEISKLKQLYEKNKDVKIRTLPFERTIHLIYNEGLVNTQDIENFISEKL